ncbi:hypothetical protein P7K49_009044, partial [Saguinus oedipus]
MQKAADLFNRKQADCSHEVRTLRKTVEATDASNLPHKEDSWEARKTEDEDSYKQGRRVAWRAPSCPLLPESSIFITNVVKLLRTRGGIGPDSVRPRSKNTDSDRHVSEPLNHTQSEKKDQNQTHG